MEEEKEIRKAQRSIVKTCCRIDEADNFPESSARLCKRKGDNVTGNT
jgi:hypothetical protein